jgi:hypothetical protein
VKKRFSVEQITAVLQQAAQGVPVGDLCRKVGIVVTLAAGFLSGQYRPVG